MLLSLRRGRAQSTFQYVFLTQIMFLCLFTLPGFFDFFGFGSGDPGDSCYFWTRFFWACSDLFLYNLATLLCFKMHQVTLEIYQFAKNGTLIPA